MHLYAIGGLGVDKRVFADLKLTIDFIPLNWIDPEPGESLTHYTRRFAKQIDTSSPFCIMGVSFGGMLALELSKIIQPEKIILISSATSPRDIPWLYRMIGRAGLFRFTPDFLMKPPPFLANWFFGVSQPRYKRLLKQVIDDTNMHFLRWATDEIAHWKNNHIPPNMVRIHGSRDRLLGYPRHEDITVLKRAGHFMVMNRAAEMSEILNRILSESV